MTKNKPLTAGHAVTVILIVLLIPLLISCTAEPEKLLLRYKYAPSGKTLEYSLDLERAGKMYKNGEFQKDFDRKLDCRIIYNTNNVFDDGSMNIIEENHWTWDEVVDSGNVKRKKVEYSYDLRIAPNGEIVDFKMIGDVSPSYQKYAASYYRQGIMIFPDSAVPIGYSWTQTAQIELTEGDSAEASITYKIKGLAKKMGYDCAIIEFRGNLVLPYLKDPADTLETWGTDYVDTKGILYFAHKEGFYVSSEERARIKHSRHLIENGEEAVKSSEFEEAGSLRLVDAGGI